MLFDRRWRVHRAPAWYYGVPVALATQLQIVSAIGLCAPDDALWTWFRLSCLAVMVMSTILRCGLLVRLADGRGSADYWFMRDLSSAVGVILAMPAYPVFFVNLYTRVLVLLE